MLLLVNPAHSGSEAESHTHQGLESDGAEVGRAVMCWYFELIYDMAFPEVVTGGQTVHIERYRGILSDEGRVWAR